MKSNCKINLTIEMRKITITVRVSNFSRTELYRSFCDSEVIRFGKRFDTVRFVKKSIRYYLLPCLYMYNKYGLYHLIVSFKKSDAHCKSHESHAGVAALDNEQTGKNSTFFTSFNFSMFT